jgi:iron complex outermembrane receptor protein
LSGSSQQTDGDNVNKLDGEREHGRDMQAGRIVSSFEPGSGLKITTIGYAGRNRSDFSAPKPVGVLPGGVDLLGYKDPYPNDPKALNFDNDGGTDLQDVGITNVIEYRFGDALLKAITGYDQSKSTIHSDVDGSPQILNQPTYFSDTEEFTQELNLSADTGPLQWVAGLFYLHDELQYDLAFHFLGSLAPLGADLPFVSANSRSTDSYAAYAQGTYSVTPAFRVTGGLRYTRDELSHTVATSLVYGYFDPSGPVAPPIPIVPQQDIDLSFGRWSYRLALEYDLAASTMAYATVNHSFKQGGVFLTLFFSPAQAAPFTAETNTAYEIGIKSTFADGLVRLNLASFYNDYQDMQVVTIIPGTLPPLTKIQNAASASSYGIDADFTLAPVRNLRIEGGIGWLHARFDSYPNATTDVLGNPIDFSGNPLPNAPDWTANAAVIYDAELVGGWTGSARVDYSYVGMRYFDGGKLALTSDEAYGLLGGRISVRSPNERMEFSAWGRNLTDTIYLDNASDLLSLGFVPRYYANRRSVGVSATLRF